MFLVELNTEVRENYAFFDPSTSVDLNLTNRRAYCPFLSDFILRGLRGKYLIDVEGKVDIEKGILKEEVKENVEHGKEQRQEEEQTKVQAKENMLKEEIKEEDKKNLKSKKKKA